MYLPILTYHRLLKEAPPAGADPKRISVSRAQFRSHLAWLSRLGYKTLSLADYPGMLRRYRAPPARRFAITFDDGYEEVLTLALPLLQEFGFTATVFAVPGELGGSNAWDDGHARLLSAGQLRTLQRAGITIGAHTSSHVHLPRVKPGIAEREISESKKRLEDVLGRPVTTFAYPYGESNSTIEAIVQKAGFEAAFSTDRAPRDHILDLYRLRRVVIFPRTNAWELLWKVQTWYPAYQDMKRSNGERGKR
jgi:peptidoglycan/xylan/chitin deacetylase (PgdA/CDA1 family)